MITDVLYKRYPESWLYADQLPPQLSQLLCRAAILFQQEIACCMPNRARLFEVAEKKLAGELGQVLLGRTSNHERPRALR